MDMKLEVVILRLFPTWIAPNVLREMGFRLDIDIVNENFRAIQFTPPNSEFIDHLRNGVTSVRAGSRDLVSPWITSTGRP
jgi:hypothetical protein